jgi:hypothetical protein
MVTWKEFAWAAFLYKYGNIGDAGETTYRQLLQPNGLGIQLVTNPTAVQATEVQNTLVKFLNRWRCRLEGSLSAAKYVKHAIEEMQPPLQVLEGCDIAKPYQPPVRQAMIRCYTQLRGHPVGSLGTRRLGPTTVSKILHVLQPHLLVMWDKAILARYAEDDPAIQDSGDGYAKFQDQMQSIAKEVDESFRQMKVSPSNQTPADYLSQKLDWNPKKTMAKYIDEFNWITITRKVPITQAWPPTFPPWQF